MGNTALDTSTVESTREEWREAVEALMDDVKSWSESAGWSVEAKSHVLTEAPFGTYTVRGLGITTPRGQLELEPIGGNTYGWRGRVDFYVWPTLIRVMLLRRSGRDWVIQTEFGPKWPHPWGRETFLQLAEALLDEQ